MKNLEKTIQLVKAGAKEKFVPIVRDKTLDALVETCKNGNVKKVLEIGTATGYSGLNMLTCKNLHLTTIEKNELRFAEAKANFENAGVCNRVNQICGDAGEEIDRLAERGEEFDLVFLDGPKGQYLKYFPTIKKLLKTGGTLFADNILLGGLLYDEARVNHKNRTMTRNMREFLQNLKNDKDFSTQIYEIEDGFCISQKK